MQKKDRSATRFSQLVNAELRAEIGRQKFSLRKLSDITEISLGRLSGVINHDKASLTTNDLDRICAALALSPTAIIRSAEKALRAEQAAELTRELPGADYYNALASRAEAALQKELAAETSPVSDKELAAEILARAEAATKTGYRLAAHPADDVLTDDSSWDA